MLPTTLTRLLSHGRNPRTLVSSPPSPQPLGRNAVLFSLCIACGDAATKGRALQDPLTWSPVPSHMSSYPSSKQTGVHPCHLSPS